MVALTGLHCMEFLSLSRRRSSARNVPSGEERGETNVFAGYRGKGVGAYLSLSGGRREVGWGGGGHLFEAGHL